MSSTPPHSILGVTQLFASAQGLHQSGDLRRAEHLYREVLRLDPSHVAALGMLGVIGCQTGNLQSGIDLLRQALARTPQDADLNNNLGMALMTRGDAQGAIPLFQQALSARPRFAEAHFNCGNALLAEGQQGAAEKQYRSALRLRADYLEAANNLGNLLFETGRADEAAQLLHRVTQLAPDAARGHFNHARALLAAGRHEAAVAACRRALALDEAQLGAWELLAQSLRRSGDLDGAAQVLARGVAIAPDAAQLWDQLGLLQFGQGRVAAAVTSFGTAARLATDQPAVATHLGMALSAQGEREAARAAFERALTLAPAHGEALRHLAEMDLEDDQAQALRARIETALDAAGEATRERSALLFALGRLRDREGDYAGAFQAFAAANQLRRRQVPFDSDAQRAFIAAVVETFSEDFFRRAAGLANDSERPVFVLGMPRSGTTLVEQIIASHAEVRGAGELTFFPEQVPALVRRAGQSSTYPRGLGRRLEALAALAPRYLALLEALDPRARRVSDKMPYNFLYLGVIGALFPRARVIHCRRDPIATCHSIFTRDLAGHHPYSYDLESLAVAYRGYQRLMTHWHQHLAVPILDLDYETLLDDQEEQTRRLVEFLELAWDPTCLRFHESRRAVATASQWQVRRPLYAEARDHWRNYRASLAPLCAALGVAGDGG